MSNENENENENIEQPELAAESPNSTPVDEAELTPDDAASVDGETESAGELSPAEMLQKLQAENAELEDRVARTQAELVNFRRRMHNELEQFRKYEGLNLVRDILPALDNLQRALRAADQSSDVANLKTGVEMVARQFVEILGKHRVEIIAAEGAPFDPNLHEAIVQQPSLEIPAMHVLNEMESGYKMHDRIVRPAKVIVSTGPTPTTESTAD